MDGEPHSKWSKDLSHYLRQTMHIMEGDNCMVMSLVSCGLRASLGLCPTNSLCNVAITDESLAVWCTRSPCLWQSTASILLCFFWTPNCGAVDGMVTSRFIAIP